jgi:hypothetical protein
MNGARRARPGGVSTAIALVVAMAVSAPHAEGAPRDKEKPAATPPDVETAEQLFAKLDYEAANEMADRVLKQRGLTHDQLVRAYRMLATTHAVLGREEESREAFLQLLIYDPDFQADPNLGPKVNTPFVEARGVFRSMPSKPGIEVVPTVRSGGGTLKVSTRDPTRVVKQVVVGYRWTSSGDFSVSEISAGNAVAVEVAPAPAGRTRLDFFAQALDERDNVVFEAGSPQVPKSAFVEAGAAGGAGGSQDRGESRSVFASPVFWVLTSAAAIGGGTALFFALRPQDPPTAAGLSPVILCGAERCN